MAEVNIRNKYIKDDVFSSQKFLQAREYWFDRGVDCGVDALIYYARQGETNLDREVIYKKALEIKNSQTNY